MRIVLSLLTILLVAGVLAQDSENTYGKTEADIVAMGQSKWYDFYTSKAGTSTADMSRAYGIYHDVAKKRNDKMPQNAKAAKLRTLLGEVGDKSIDIAYNITGGGTMWIPVRAELYAEVEDVIYPVLGGRSPAAKPAKVSLVTGELAKVHAAIEKSHADKDSGGYFKYEEAKKDFAMLKADFEKIAVIAKNLDRANSDRILQFCRNAANLAIGDMS